MVELDTDSILDGQPMDGGIGESIDGQSPVDADALGIGDYSIGAFPIGVEV